MKNPISQLKYHSSYIIFIFFILFFFNEQSIAQNIQQNKKIAYTIEIPARQINGKTIPSQTYTIAYVDQDQYLKNVIHIKFKSKLGKNDLTFAPNSIKPLLNEIGVTTMRLMADEQIVNSIADQDYYGIGRIYELNYSADQDPYDVCMLLMNDPSVEYAVPVFMRYPDSFTPNDPNYTNQYALPLIQANKAWDITKGDTNIMIGICDVGTDWKHEDLRANIWSNRKEIPNNGIDDDGNGKVDDVHGWDFVGNVSYAGSWKEDNDPANIAQQHGTHVAGIASAVTNNGKGVASIGYSCRLLPVKLGSDNASLQGVYRGYDGILYAAKMGANVINCSWGGSGFSASEQDIINQATAMGSLVVTASGNYANNSDEAPHYPGSYKNVLNVGSSTSTDQIAMTSNYGFTVQVFAPGDNILSTYPNNQYQTISGTSMASPLVSGLAGLVAGLHKNWTPNQIIHQIRGTCDKFPGMDDFTRLHYFGRINAYKAVLFNNDSFPDKTIPGIYNTAFKVNSGTKITTHNPVHVTIDVTNCLSEADTVNIHIKSLDPYVSIDTTVFMIRHFDHGDTNHITFNLQVLNNFPWDQGNLELMLTYQSKDYFDLDKVAIPVDYTVTNIFTTVTAFNPLLGPVWNGLSSTSQNLVWGIGNSSVYGYALYFVGTGSISSGFVTYNSSYVTDALYCIGSSGIQRAIAGTSKGYVYRSINGGGQWTRTDVSSVTNFINAVHFYDDDNVILLGDPAANNWGVGLSTNGGLSFNKVFNIPAPLSSETGLVESSYFNGKEIWFGTTKGRLFYSPDSGKTWTADTMYLGGVVTHMAFLDKNRGLVAYRESSSTTDPLYLGSTNDGGKTWTKRIMNLTDNDQIPLTFSGLPLSKIILTRYRGGDTYQTSDLGASVSPVTSTKTVTYTAGSIFRKNGFVQLWAAGIQLSKLEYNYNIDTGSGINEIHAPSALSVYPNPVSQLLTVAFNSTIEKPVEMMIYDETGKLVEQVAMQNKVNVNGTFQYDVTRLNKGIFFLAVKLDSGKTLNTIFVKQ